MKKLYLNLLLLLPALTTNAQSRLRPAFPVDSVICTCLRADLDCGTADNVKQCFAVLPDWPDSLVHDTYFEYFAWPFDWEKKSADSNQLVRFRENRYKYYTTCPQTDSGVFDLGIAGKMAFRKSDGWVTCRWLEKGSIGNFLFEITNCDMPQKSVELDVKDYEIHWMGKQFKKPANE